MNNLILLEAPEEITEVISLADVKKHLRIEHDEDDDLIEIYYLTAAIDYAEEYTGRSLTVNNWRYTMPSWKKTVELPKPPLVDVTSIKYYDTDNELQTLASTEYITGSPYQSRGYVYFLNTLPQVYCRPDAIQIDFTAGEVVGFAATLIAAILLLTGHFYENREAEKDKISREISIGVHRLLDLWTNGGYY